MTESQAGPGIDKNLISQAGPGAHINLKTMEFVTLPPSKFSTLAPKADWN